MDTTLEEYTIALMQPVYKELPKVAFKVSSRVPKGAVDFLNKVACNDMHRAKNAILDRFGKLVVFFDQLVVGGNIFVAFEKQFKDRFLSGIGKYAALAKVAVEETPLKVFHILGFGKLPDIGALRIPQNIGYLSLLPDSSGLGSLREISENTYAIFRLENDIPLQGIDFDQQMFLEIARDGWVSFTKGCYPGQEVMTRVHNLSNPGRKLVRILYEKVPAAVTINGTQVGTITSKCFSYQHKKFLVFAAITNYHVPVDDGEYLRYGHWAVILT